MMPSLSLSRSRLFNTPSPSESALRRDTLNPSLLFDLKVISVAFSVVNEPQSAFESTKLSAEFPVAVGPFKTMELRPTVPCSQIQSEPSVVACVSSLPPDRPFQTCPWLPIVFDISTVVGRERVMVTRLFPATIPLTSKSPSGKMFSVAPETATV